MRVALVTFAMPVHEMVTEAMIADRVPAGMCGYSPAEVTMLEAGEPPESYAKIAKAQGAKLCRKVEKRLPDWRARFS